MLRNGLGYFHSDLAIRLSMSDKSKSEADHRRRHEVSRTYMKSSITTDPIVAELEALAAEMNALSLPGRGKLASKALCWAARKSLRLVAIGVIAITVGCSQVKSRPIPSSAPQPGPAPLFVWVSGEVRVPGRFPWTNGLTAAGAIQLAGGFVTNFALRSIEIRQWDGSGESYRLSSDLRFKHDVVLRPGDSVINPKW